MERKDKAEMVKAMTVMAEVYQREISTSLVDIYFRALEKLSIEEVSAAFSRHLQDKTAGQYFPKPADILRQIEGDDEGRAIAAWVEVRKAIQHIGIYQSVKFDDPVIMMCIDRMGGWMELCNILTSEVGYKEAEFIKLYKHYQKFPIDNAPKYLVGWHEQQNRFNGYDEDIPDPTEIKTRKELPENKENINDKKTPAFHSVRGMA